MSIIIMSASPIPRTNEDIARFGVKNTYRPRADHRITCVSELWRMSLWFEENMGIKITHK